MNFIQESSRKIPVMRKVNVLVVGGGPAGFGAAIAAARNGAETLLIERYGFLGGMLTAGLVIWIPYYNLVPIESYGETKALQGGIIQELTERLLNVGGAATPSLTSPSVVGLGWFGFPTDPEINKIVFVEMLEEAKAEILLHALVVGVVKDGKRVKGVIVESKSGRQAVLADTIVDASGDADVAAFAGAEYDKVDKPMMMTAMGFFGNVDFERASEFAGIENKDRFSRLVDEAVKKGDLTIKEAPGLHKQPPVKGFSMIDPKRTPTNWYRTGEAGGWLQHASGDCTNVHDLTKAELSTRKSLLPIINFYRKYVPGYEKAYLSYTNTQIGLRESRRVLGDYFLTADRDIKEGLKHEDVITKCRLSPPGYNLLTYTLERSLSEYTPDKLPVFDIPYRCIVPKVIDNLLVAGRCISVDHKAAISSSPREEATCICLGQAAGTAAALSVKNKITPRELSITALQQTLKMQGANLG